MLPFASTIFAYTIVDIRPTTDAEYIVGIAPVSNRGQVRHEFLVDALRIIAAAIAHVLGNAIEVGPTAVIGVWWCRDSCGSSSRRHADHDVHEHKVPHLRSPVDMHIRFNA